MRAKISTLALYCLVFLTTALPGLAQAPYSSADLDTLVGPIALYPDPVLTNVIRASTFPDQVVAASKTNTDVESWDDSVKALDDYPDVLTMMAGNVSWMKSLGWASTNQLADLMDAVQRFRYRAQQAGNLSSNSKTVVIQEGTIIRIEPANPQVIYVPTYNPVYVSQANFGNAFWYGAGIATSAYLWNNVYHWNNNSFYRHPYGWYPPANYYRPYGWQSGGIYGGNTVRLNGGNTVVRGPVTVNNINVNNRTRVGNTNVGNTVNRNTVNRNTVNQNSGNRNTVNRTNVNSGNYNNRVQTETRTNINRPAVTNQAPAINRTYSNPGLGSYSSAGATSRESARGAYSRQTTSFSSGARGGGGSRGGRRR